MTAKSNWGRIDLLGGRRELDEIFVRDCHLVPGSVRIVADSYLAAPAIAVPFAAHGDHQTVERSGPSARVGEVLRVTITLGVVKRPRIREEDEAVAREQADRRREALLARLKAREEATRKPADAPLPDDEAAPAATESPADTTEPSSDT
jgi:hypothetical protein